VSLFALIVSALSFISSFLTFATNFYFNRARDQNDAFKRRSDVLQAILTHIGSSELRNTRSKLHSFGRLSESAQRELYQKAKIEVVGRDGKSIKLEDTEIRSLIVGYDRLAYLFRGDKIALDEACMVQIDTIPVLISDLSAFIDECRKDDDRLQPHYAHDISVLFDHFHRNHDRLLDEVQKRMICFKQTSSYLQEGL
jgi:hypothetical protein